MILNIRQDPSATEVEINIRCGTIDPRLAALIRQIQLYGYSVAAKRDGRSYTLAPEDIFYFESVDEKTFVCCESDVYQSGLRLYELEQQLENSTFARVSKSILLNTAKVVCVRPMLGGRLEAQLDNGEKVMVNRHYVQGLRAMFGLEGAEL